MKAINQKLIFGLLIVFLGLIILLNNFHLFDIDDQLWWGIAFAVLGFVFINVYRRSPQKKGPLVVGIILLVIGHFSMFDALGIISDNFFGVFVLWGLAAIFIVIFIRNNERWWAVIPGGALLILGFLKLIEEFRILDNDFSGFIFLFGMSLIFWFLYMTRDDKKKFGWSQIVAIILLIVSLFVLAKEFNSQAAEILFPVSIIVCGCYLIIKGMLADKKQPTKE